MLSNKNIKILINYVAGPLLFAWVAWSLYHQLSSQPDLPEAWKHIKESLKGPHSWILVMIILMMFLNWGIEARKWQILLKKLEPVNFFTAMKAIFSGVAFSVTMPNRIGEYGGRLLFLKEGNRIRSVSLTLIGSLAQLIITLIMGVAGLIYVQREFPIETERNFFGPFINAAIVVLAILSLIALLFYFKVSLITRWLEKMPVLSKVKAYIEVLDSFPARTLFNILWLSFLRYLVFTLQYVWLLQLLQVDIVTTDALFLVSVLFLMLSLYPTFALLELVIRQQLGVAILSMASNNVLGIMAASIGIWLINLVLPAMAGSLLMISVKLFRNKNV